MRYLLPIVLILSACTSASATQDEPPAAPTTAMTGAALSDIVRTLDSEAQVEGNGAIFTLQERDMMLVFDEAAGRMRVVTPILPSALLDEDILIRMAQANYDAALDARYAIANDQVWAVFIHPLPSLTEDDFLSGLAQTYTAAETFGTTYSSGAVVFGGGDTSGIFEDLEKQIEDAKQSRERI